MLQSVLDPRANLHQLVTVNQQLAQIPLLGRRHPQLRKATLHQQLQNVSCIAPVGLLTAHIAGPDLGRIPDPYLMPQPLQQLDEPLAVPARFDPYQRRPIQSAIKPLCLALAVDQLALADLPGLRIENRYLLPPWMKITPYNLHEGFSGSSSSGPQPKANRSLKPSYLSHQFKPGVGLSGLSSLHTPGSPPRESPSHHRCIGTESPSQCPQAWATSRSPHPA